MRRDGRRGAARRRACRPASSRCCPGEGDVGCGARARPARARRSPSRARRRGPEILAAAAEVRRRAAPHQARHRRDGRQELRDRRLRRGPRRGRPRDHALGVRLRRPEVLGCRARARARGDRRGVSLERLAGASTRCRSARPTRSASTSAAVIEAQRASASSATAGIAAARADRPAPARSPTAGLLLPRRALVSDLAEGLAACSREEIFGPLLALETRRGRRGGAATRIEALALRAHRRPVLRNPRTVARRRRALPVGNLYVNRHITGAMVGRQPFGGNRLSGRAQSRRPRLPARVRRRSRRQRERGAPRSRRVSATARRGGRMSTGMSGSRGRALAPIRSRFYSDQCGYVITATTE